MENAYFHIKDATIAGEKLVLSGDYTMPGTLKVNTSPSIKKQKISGPGILKPFKVKWILPPKGSWFYDLVKGAAESAGYETVENDDLSYPGLR